MTTVKQSEIPEAGKVYIKVGTRSEARDVTAVKDGHIRYCAARLDGDRVISRTCLSVECSVKTWARWWRRANIVKIVDSPWLR